MDIDVNIHELEDFSVERDQPIEIIIAHIAIDEIFKDYDDDFSGDFKYLEWRLHKLLGFEFTLEVIGEGRARFSTIVDGENHTIDVIDNMNL